MKKIPKTKVKEMERNPKELNICPSRYLTDTLYTFTQTLYSEDSFSRMDYILTSSQMMHLISDAAIVYIISVTIRSPSK